MEHLLNQITGIINLFVVLIHFKTVLYFYTPPPLSAEIIRKLWFSGVLRGIEMEHWLN